MSRSAVLSQPEWVCDSCGKKYGAWYASGSYIGPARHCPTYHEDSCSVCGEHTHCTEARDFGYLDPAWTSHYKNTKNL
jgi:hypothetical protein